MKELLKIILGDATLSNFVGLLFFALLGAALSLLLQATKRDPKSLTSPVCFSWSFFWNDNTKRIITGLILIYCFLRFLPEITGVQITSFYALLIGIGNDKLAQLLKDKTNFLGQKKEA